MTAQYVTIISSLYVIVTFIIKYYASTTHDNVNNLHNQYADVQHIST